jgi:cytochrome o ubiquinol oxidase subunit III
MTTAHEHSSETTNKTLFGFWIYLLSDCLFFGSLFITYMILKKSNLDGPGPKELFSHPFALYQTLLFLFSAFSMEKAHRSHKNLKTFFFFLSLSAILAIGFLSLEGIEWTHLIRGGNSWNRNAFLSAYFTLLGFHAVHLILALLWMALISFSIFRFGFQDIELRRFICLKMLWQFLNGVWIFIFSLVYLMGVYA